jgi:CheY-like chemotaxis protein
MATRILYIEDNYYNIVLVKKILTSNGFEFFEAKNGLEGIEKAKEIKPDLILMDINLPELSGLEVTTKIRSLKELEDVKIIAITADVSEGSREKALTAGCDGYIPKPIESDFVDRIKEFLTGKKETLASDDEKLKYLKQYSSELADKLEDKVKKLTEANKELEKAYKSIQTVNKKLLLLNQQIGCSCLYFLNLPLIFS